MLLIGAQPTSCNSDFDRRAVGLPTLPGGVLPFHQGSASSQAKILKWGWRRAGRIGWLLSAAERKLRAKAAAHALHAQGGTSTTAGTRAFLARFEREVDPDGALSPDERARRADHALRSHMAKLALRSSQQRARRQDGSDR